VGGGQVVEEQAVPLPRYVPWCAAQSASVVTMQLTVLLAGRQHAPVAGWQVVFVHGVPLPR
jgi:hypothetical protein